MMEQGALSENWYVYHELPDIHQIETL